MPDVHVQQKVRLKIHPVEASVLMQDLSEIDQLKLLVQVRSSSNNRFAGMLVSRGGEDFSRFSSYSVTVDGDDSYMELTVKS